MRYDWREGNERKIKLNPEKREKLLNIYDESFLHVVGSTDNFVRFLEQISYLHKYSIDEQLCIHGQMPEAKHLASFDTWVRLGRFVKRGQKAVSALRFTGENVSGLHFFDYTQTYGKKLTFPDYSLPADQLATLLKQESIKEKINERVKEYSMPASQENIAKLIGQKLLEFKVTGQSINGIQVLPIDSFQDPKVFVQMMDVANEINRLVSKEVLTLKNEERMKQDELQRKQRGRTHSRTDISGKQTVREIRENSSRETETAGQSRIRDKNDERHLDELWTRDREKSVESNQRVRESVRTTESANKKTATGHTDSDKNSEPVSGASNGSSNERTNQLNNKEPMTLLKEELVQGTGTENGKYRIVHFFNNVKAQTLRTTFLKNEYGSYGHAGPGMPFVLYSSRGVTIDDNQYSWKQVIQALDELIVKNQYLIEGERIGYQHYKSTLVDDELRELKQNNTENNSENSQQEFSLFDFSPEEIEATPVTLSETIPTEKKAEAVLGKGTPQPFYFPNTDGFYDTKPKEKIRNNLAAIRLSKEIQQKNRFATLEEQTILAKYVGWGGIAEVFDTRSDKYEKEREELRTLVTENQYKQMRESVLTAYYTDPMIIKEMYRKVEDFGFKGGKILDPSMGTGNFFSALPDNLKEQSELHGIELDEITGTIAKQLHPEANIQIKGFEEVGPLTDQYDLVISNVPFDQQKVTDSQFERRYSIHNYFLRKAIDSVHDGGIVAIITSTNTLESSSRHILLDISKEAELLGAARLPNNAFKKIAGTEVTTDILFFQKDKTLTEKRFYSPEWCFSRSWKHEGSVSYNEYYHSHPEQICGQIDYKNYRGGVLTVNPSDTPLSVELKQAFERIEGTYFGERKIVEEVGTKEEEGKESITKEDIPLFTHEIIDNKIYYNDSNEIEKINVSGKQMDKMKRMIEIRNTLLDVIAIQREVDYDVATFDKLLEQLNQAYDTFVEKYGSINDNQKVLMKDDYLPLLRSIEIVEKDGSITKSEIFNQATIRPKNKTKNVSSALEALYASLGNRLMIDWEYMSTIYSKPPEDILDELGEKVFLDPNHYDKDNLFGEGWQEAEEYLSGDVKTKLLEAKRAAEKEPTIFERNYLALQEVQPTPIKAGEIEFSIGSTWIPTDMYQDFMYETFETRPYYINYNMIQIEKDPVSVRYFIKGKGQDKSAVVTNQYGTKRASAYAIFENSLNLKKVEVKDKVLDGDKYKYVLNPNETAYARSKQDQLEEVFRSWVFKKDERIERLQEIYEERFNRIVPRSYSGEHLVFPGLNELYELRPHQKNVVARIIQNGRALMAHTVGAGKTLSMISAGMLMKDQGLINKPLYVVPNHLTNEFGNELLRFYPAKKVLITNKKDFEKKNRQAFISKIAMGNYDAVIIGHSQYEKISLSPEKQKEMLQEEIDQVSDAIATYQMESDEDNWSIKQMIAFEKRLEERLANLNKLDKKDKQIYFEDLGVDFLFVDEAHQYKNLYSYTKLSNVAGVNSSNSLRASDQEMKCRYLMEKQNNRGVVFATGTPVSNSMSELFTMQKYLQPDILKQYGVYHFDAWASTFGEIVSSLEITPEGTGYQMKNRFAKFHNLPELMQMYNLVADIQTASMLRLPVPKVKTGKAQVIVTQLTTYQKEKVDQLAERAERIRAKEVTSDVDNMLKITNEGKLMALDPRLMEDYDPERYSSEELKETKLAACVNKVAEIWESSKEKKSTQIIFSDSGTPNPKRFNIYDEIKRQLIEKGIPAEEITFIHDAKNEKQREEIFDAMREGEIRILLGSTSKLGTGTNVQRKLIACHHVDCPWRPSDIEQRDGRIVRQGNENEEVEIYRYVTKGSLDSFLWQIQEQKLTFINQVMTGKAITRSCDELSDTVLEAGDMKAIASGNPKIAEKMKLDNEITRLKMMQRSFVTEKESLKWKIKHEFPSRIVSLKETVSKLEQDQALLDKTIHEEFVMTIDGEMLTERTKAAEKLDEVCTIHKDSEQFIPFGEYRGLTLQVRKNFHEYGNVDLRIVGKATYVVTNSLGNGLGGIRKIENETQRIPKYLEDNTERLTTVQDQFNKATERQAGTFPHEEELNEKLALQAKLNQEIQISLENDKSKSTRKEQLIEQIDQVEIGY
ncbi:SNF2-related protein [Enterococcus faecalis]|uniref:SNF2-related protein n=1 Tax=Enterococcus faecalis TaxID=1351 RepID=UPI003FCEB322